MRGIKTGRLVRRKVEKPERQGEDETLRSTWYVIGRRGAVQFVYFKHLAGGWMAEHAKTAPPGIYTMTADGHALMAVDVGYHSPTPRYDDQPSMGGCDVLEGDCFYDGSGLAGIRLLELWAENFFDDEVVWRYLELDYVETFHEETGE